jgi:hypothetical protein
MLSKYRRSDISTVVQANVILSRKNGAYKNKKLDWRTIVAHDFVQLLVTRIVTSYRQLHEDYLTFCNHRIHMMWLLAVAKY